MEQALWQEQLGVTTGDLASTKSVACHQTSEGFNDEGRCITPGFMLYLVLGCLGQKSEVLVMARIPWISFQGSFKGMY